MSPSPSPKPEHRKAEPDPAEMRVLAHSPAQAFRLGMMQTIPFLIVIVPFAILFGVVALEAGIDMLQILGFSVLVFAGASQFTAVQLLSDQAPLWLVIVSALAVNLRLAMYSASLVPWLREANDKQRIWFAYLLIDQSYALSIQHYERFPRLNLKQKLAYFLGASLLLCVPWVLCSLLGAAIGRSIPDSIALDFAIPLTFLAMAAPMLRTPAHLTACFVAVTASLALAGLPSGTGLLIAAPLGMAAGALVEWRMERGRSGI